MAPAILDSQVKDQTSVVPQISHKFPPESDSEAYAQSLDASDSLSHLRDNFIIPTKASLHTTTLTNPDTKASNSEQSIYFCGNSLGLQPKCTANYLTKHLSTWSSIGVYGHFTQLTDSPLVPWQNMAEFAAEQSARLVGADKEDVAIANTLSINLHLLLASFYQPEASHGGSSGKKNKILMEKKAFPSDHYVVESQVRWHGLDPAENMILLEPEEGQWLIDTQTILDTIEEKQDEIALILLPGIQYYTGQLFDIERITKFAHERGITIGWDLAHAAGNVEIQLKEWDVDFAAWCTYKYMNAGPGAIAGMYVNEKHGRVTENDDGSLEYRPRLMGWYGGDKSSRFKMDNNFRPIPRAGGFQVSNPSAIDLVSLCASLSVFNKTTIQDLRARSLKLTAYLQYLLLKDLPENEDDRPYRIITPLDPTQRGAQLSVLLKPGLLKTVAAALKDAGIVADQREPDVIRVAPVPMYNTFNDVRSFVRQLKTAVQV